MKKLFISGITIFLMAVSNQQAQNQVEVLKKVAQTVITLNKEQ